MAVRRRVAIAGAAGRDFHDFNVLYRDDPGHEVVAFTAAQGRRVVVVEDGPTLTHGGMAYGAGFIAARQAGAREIVDPRAAAAPGIAALYAQYPHIGPVLPAVGYSAEQLEALRLSLDAVDADLIVSATPADLARLMRLEKPVLRAGYEFADLDQPGLWGRVEAFLRSR